MGKIIIVRHGYSISNFNKTFTGQLDIGLSDIGLEQGKLVSNYIFENYKIDAIYSSDLSRAYDTIKPLSILTGLTIITDEQLREMNGGEWQGKKIDSLAELYPIEYAKWKNFDKDMCPPGGESMIDVRKRAIKVFTKIAEANQDKTIVITSHGALIRSFISHIMGLPIERLKELPYVSNAAIIEIEFKDGQFKIINGCIDHYLKEMRTEMPKGV